MRVRREEGGQRLGEREGKRGWRVRDKLEGRER